MATELLDAVPFESDSKAISVDDSGHSPHEFDAAAISEFLESKQGKSCLRGEWRHDKSVSSAYWDPRGRAIVSTSYDDNLRCE